MKCVVRALAAVAAAATVTATAAVAIASVLLASLFENSTDGNNRNN